MASVVVFIGCASCARLSPARSRSVRFSTIYPPSCTGAPYSTRQRSFSRVVPRKLSSSNRLCGSVQNVSSCKTDVSKYGLQFKQNEFSVETRKFSINVTATTLANVFFCYLEVWFMTLTSKSDLGSMKVNQHDKYPGQRSFSSKKLLSGRLLKLKEHFFVI